MNTVLNSYGQLYGCPEILKKIINFFVVGLTYGWRRSWNVICGNPFFCISLTNLQYIACPLNVTSWSVSTLLINSLI